MRLVDVRERNFSSQTVPAGRQRAVSEDAGQGPRARSMQEPPICRLSVQPFHPAQKERGSGVAGLRVRFSGGQQDSLLDLGRTRLINAQASWIDGVPEKISAAKTTVAYERW